jgi:integrase
LEDGPRERLLTAEEFKALLENCTDGNTSGAAQDLREQLTALRHSTMRPGELRNMKWEHVKFDQHLIVLPGTSSKNRRRREVTITEQVEKVLRARQQRMEKWGVGTKGRYVFPLPGLVEGVRTAGVGDRPQGKSKFAQRFRRLVERCVAKSLIEKEVNGERIVPYTTRHTRCTEMFSLGHDHATVQHDMGHTNPRTTERYKHLAGSDVARKIREREKGSGGSEVAKPAAVKPPSAG